MTKFGHLAQYRVKKDASTIFSFKGLGGVPSLVVRPTSSNNEEFKKEAGIFEAKVKRINQLAQAGSDTNDLLVKVISDHFFAVIIIGWATKFEIKGVELEFNKENVNDLLAQVPDYSLLELLEFVKEPRNFIGGDELDLGDFGEEVKNL